MGMGSRRKLSRHAQEAVSFERFDIGLRHVSVAKANATASRGIDGKSKPDCNGR